MKSNRQIDVARALALAATFNFLRSCAGSFLLPFLTLYFRQLGLTPAMSGVVLGTKRLIALAWSPAAALLSKHYDKRRLVICGSVACSAAVALVLLLLPSAGADAQTSTCNVSDASVSPTQRPSGFRTTAHTPAQTRPGEDSAPRSSLKSVSVVVPEPNTSSSSSSSSRRKRWGQDMHSDFLGSLKAMDTQHQLFYLILIVVSVWELVSAPLDWTADDGLYEYLDFADAAERSSSSSGVWGLLGAACGVLGAGLLVSQLPCVIAGQRPRGAVLIYCYAAVAALVLPVAAHLPLYLNKKRGRADGLLKAVQLVRGSPRALLCAVTALLVGVAAATVDDFLLWQMQDRGSNELHMGLCLAAALLSQAAFPLLAGRLSRLLSPGKVLAVGAASLSLQCFYYSFLWGPWAALPAQVLSCLSRGAFWWAVRVQCEDVATPGAERSVRRVYSAVCLQLGSGLGSLAGGFAAQSFGLTWTFRGAAAVLMLWCVFLPLLQCRAPHQRRINYSRLLAADTSEASDSESEQERDWLDKAMEDDRSDNKHGRRVDRSAT